MHVNRKENNVYLSPAPAGLEEEFRILLSHEAIQFLVDLNLHFQDEIENLYTTRLEKKCLQKKTNKIPKFLKSNYVKDDWMVAPVSKYEMNENII